MSNSYRYISANRCQAAVVLTIELKRVDEYEIAEAMGKELIAAARQDVEADVVVDMQNLEFMSSVGYGPFISLRRHVVDSGRRLVLCNLCKLLRQMFETTRLLISPQHPKALFDFTDTVEDAMKTLSSQP